MPVPREPPLAEGGALQPDEAPVPLGRALPLLRVPVCALCCCALHGIVLPLCWAVGAGGCLAAAAAGAPSATGALLAAAMRGGREGPAPPPPGEVSDAKYLNPEAFLGDLKE